MSEMPRLPLNIELRPPKNMRKKADQARIPSIPAVPTPKLDAWSIIRGDLYPDLWKQLTDRLSQTSRLDLPPAALAGPSEPSDLSRNLPERRAFGKNMRRLVKLVHQAVINPVYIPFDVEEYYNDFVKGKKGKTPLKFPKSSLGTFSKPLTVVDVKGRIVLWYLPGLLSARHQGEVNQGTLDIAPLLRPSVKKVTPGKVGPCWRVAQPNFATGCAGRLCEPGAVTFSAGWFAQGHAGDQFELKPSANLNSSQLQLGGGDWMESTKDVEIFLNMTLSLIHPELFQTGRGMLQKLRNLDATKSIADRWQSVYTGIQVISNRVTPVHRDSQGRPEWFNLLLSYCGSAATPHLLVEDLGLDLEYSTGTVVGLCGMVLKHEVKAWGAGDRVCYAHFMREAVRKKLGGSPASWVNQSTYSAHLPGEFTCGGDDDSEAMDLGH